jgi:multidrug resistance efflux pump
MTLGVAQTVNVADGGHVEAGHVLIGLDCGPLAKDIDVRAASLRPAREPRTSPRPRPSAIKQAAFLDEGKAEFDQCTVRAPAAGTVKVLVTLGQYVSTFAPTTLVQLKPDVK